MKKTTNRLMTIICFFFVVSPVIGDCSICKSPAINLGSKEIHQAAGNNSTRNGEASGWGNQQLPIKKESNTSLLSVHFNDKALSFKELRKKQESLTKRLGKYIYRSNRYVKKILRLKSDNSQYFRNRYTTKLFKYRNKIHSTIRKQNIIMNMIINHRLNKLSNGNSYHSFK